MPGVARFRGAGAWISKHLFTVFFNVFMLFTTRRNRAFWLLCLVFRLRRLTTFAIIVFEWLKRIEPSSTTLYDPRIRSKSVHSWASTETFPAQQRRNFAYYLRTADDLMQMNVHKTLYPLYRVSLCWLNLTSQSFVWNVFCTSDVRKAFSFHKLPNIHFFEHFLVSTNHNLKSTARTTRAEKKQES